MKYSINDIPKTDILHCEKCSRKIRYYYDIDYELKGLKASEQVICPYCKYEELDDELKEEPLNLLVNGLKKIESEDNLALSYWKFFDEEFALTYNGQNPYQEYFLSKEVYDRFSSLITFEDYYQKHLACKIIARWEESEEYDELISQLEKEAKDKFGRTFDENNMTIEKTITYDFMDNIHNVFEILNTSLDETMREKSIVKLKEQLENIHNDKYLLNNKFIDISEMLSMDSIPGKYEYDLKDDLISKTDSSMECLYEYSFIQFECWKMNKEPRIINDCLEKLSMYLQLNYYNLLRTDDNIENYSNKEANTQSRSIYDTNTINNIEGIVEDFTLFYELYKDVISEIEISSKYRTLNKRERKGSPVILAIDGSGELTKGSIITLLKDTIDPLYMFYTVLLELQKNIESNIQNRLDHENLIKIRTLKGKFEPGYESILNGIYNNKAEFNYVGNNEIKKIKVQLNSLIQYMDKFNSETISKGDLMDLFLCKKAMFSQFAGDTELEELDELLNQLLENIINILNINNTEIKFINIDKKLKSQLKDKFKNIEGTVYDSLLTAEYLFSIFIEESNDVLDIIKMNKDYSCISIMYYKALEDAFNKLIYQPYASKYIKPLCKKISNTAFDPSVKIEDFFTTTNLSNINRFYFKPYKPYLPVDNLMMGNLGHFLLPDKNKDMPRYLSEYLTSIMNHTEDEIKEICKTLGNDLLGVTRYRNTAAHGGEIINSEGVKRDKRNVFVHESKEYKRILFNLLEMLK